MRTIIKPLDIYIETSVWSFFYAEDAPEKMDITRQFFAGLPKSSATAYISPVVLRELMQSPTNKRISFLELVEKVKPTSLKIADGIEPLASAYAKNGIVPSSKLDDARHVAFATLYEMDVLVSWNFKHLANIRRSEGFNGVNLQMGYTKKLSIVNPWEVLL